MKKVFVEAAVLVVAFFAILFGMSKVDWMAVFRVEKVTKTTEEKLGDAFWNIFKHSETEFRDRTVVNTVDSIVDKICEKNNIDREQIKVHILMKNEVNAFALPNDYLIIFSGLLSECENPEELAGVIGHEIAHMELDHIMKKLSKEVGISMLIGISTGGRSAEAVKQVAKVLSSTAFDRSLEEEADIRAVDYMVKAEIDPEPFANFLFRLSTGEDDAMKYFSWASTHPDSRDRSEYIIEYGQDKIREIKPIISEESWEEMQEILSNP